MYVRDVHNSYFKARLVDCMISEGEFWGEYYTRLANLGDYAYVDKRYRLKYPFAHYGILVRDDRRKTIFTDKTLLNFLDLATIKSGGIGLDVGCGSGWLSLELARRRINMVGIDIALEALVVAKKYRSEVSEKVEYVHADARYPPFRPGTFDLLTGYEAYHHIPDLYICLKRLRNCLKQDALVVISDHCSLGPTFVRLFRGIFCGPHVIALFSKLYGVTRLVTRTSSATSKKQTINSYLSGSNRILTRFVNIVARLILGDSPHIMVSLAEDINRDILITAFRKVFTVTKEEYRYGFAKRAAFYLHFILKKNTYIYMLADAIARLVDKLLALILPQRAEHIMIVAKV